MSIGTGLSVRPAETVTVTSAPPVGLDHPTTVPANVGHEGVTEDESPEDRGSDTGGVSGPSGR